MPSSLALASLLNSISVEALDAAATGFEVVSGIATAFGAGQGAEAQILAGEVNATRAANDAIREGISLLGEELSLIGEEDASARRSIEIERDALELKANLIAIQGTNLTRAVSSGITGRGSVAVVNRTLEFEAMVEAAGLASEGRGERLTTSTIRQLLSKRDGLHTAARLRGNADASLARAAGQSGAARLYGEAVAANLNSIGAIVGYAGRRRKRRVEEEERSRVPFATGGGAPLTREQRRSGV